ncbi:hypothetical protein HQN59_03015 [Schlegelella sp. ID0723]|uniref:Uncharacterized protein n=2 Tax=Piscinibacter koreensis TaxID=2742824 RepID=A0A7Y6NKE9_9BURK|nr:hypothetical protein [Schlegelella koreensis]
MPRLGILAVLIALANCGGLDGGTVSGRLGRQIRNPAVTHVDLASVTSFGWDEVFLFPPQTPRASVCATLAVRERFCRLIVRTESLDDETMTIAFRKQGRVTHAELHRRINGDFLPLDNEQRLRREDARFRVVADGLGDTGDALLRLVRE